MPTPTPGDMCDSYKARAVSPLGTPSYWTETTQRLGRGFRRIRELAEKAAGDVMFFFITQATATFGQSLHLGTSRYPLKTLNRAESVNAKLRIAVVDACRSLDDTQAKGFAASAPFDMKMGAPKGIEGVVTIRSSAEGEASQESLSWAARCSRIFS